MNLLIFCVSSWSNLCWVIFIMRGVCPHYPGCLICWHTIIYPCYFCKACSNVLTFISNFSYLSLSLSFWLKVCQFHCCFQRTYFCFCWFSVFFVVVVFCFFLYLHLNFYYFLLVSLGFYSSFYSYLRCKVRLFIWYLFSFLK